MMRAMLAVVLTACSLTTATAAEADRQAADEAAIRTTVEAYVAAFNQGDAKKLAAMWSPEAVYTNPRSGEQVVGREAIEKQFADLFAASKGVKLEAKTDSVQFVSPNVAVERGTAKLTREGQAPVESEYSAVYMKRDGQWLLDRVTEEDVPVVASHHEKLKELDWMVGTWVDQDEESRIETTCNWTRNQNFMTRWFSLSIRDRVEMAGVQIIGWDPAAEKIRSWVFDSDGGFGEGIWSRKGDKWFIQSTGVLPDGQKTTAVNIITRLDEDRFTWQSVNREANGELLPNVDEVVVVRQSDGD
jgi:uncharacterized protein (TIGR02246 family)